MVGEGNTSGTHGVCVGQSETHDGYLEPYGMHGKAWEEAKRCVQGLRESRRWKIFS